MPTTKTIAQVAKHIARAPEQLISEGIVAVLHTKRAELLAERQEWLERYGVRSAHELKARIKAGRVSEYPAWTDYLELKNLESDLDRLGRDLHTLHKAR